MFAFCSDMTTTMALLTPAHRQDKCVSHALRIRAAWALSNYHRFFRLYRCAPKMSGYIIDWFMERERKQALKIMIKSYVSFQLYITQLKGSSSNLIHPTILVLRKTWKPFPAYTLNFSYFLCSVIRSYYVAIVMLTDRDNETVTNANKIT